jgi:hypothetical protein
MWLVTSGDVIVGNSNLFEGSSLGYFIAVILGVPETSEVQCGTEINILFQKAPFVYLDVHLLHTNLEIS